MKLAFTNKFLKQVSKIQDKNLAKEIEKIIESTDKVTSLSEIKNLKKLKGYRDFYRIRVGDYRIGINYNNEVSHLPPLTIEKIFTNTSPKHILSFITFDTINCQ